MSLDSGWQLHPRVSLRPEPFGALAYHYDNRRLNFLRSPDLVRVINSLGDHTTVALALSDCGIDPQQWPTFEKALSSLAASDFLQPQELDPHEQRPEEAA
jgi:putative mycofactocin binding protein MftB